MSTAMQSKIASSATRNRAEQKVKADIQSMLQVNGNTPTAHAWVPRVVMMTYERRCANDPGNGELAECYRASQEIAAAQEIAARS